MISPEILRPVVGGDLLEWCRIVRISDDTAEVRGPLVSVLDIAKSRVKRAGFHAYAVPTQGGIKRFRVRAKGAR